MLHLVAFIVIGLIIGAVFVRKTRSMTALARVAGGLVGSLGGGFIALNAIGSKTDGGKYGSIVIAVVVSVLLAALTTALTNVVDLGGRD